MIFRCLKYKVINTANTLTLISVSFVKFCHRVVLAKLLYASPAWWGYASTSDKQRIDAFIRRGFRLGFYGTTDPTAQQLAEEADQTMFREVRYRDHHVLHHLLPDIISHCYSLRPRSHNYVLTKKLMNVILSLDRFSNIYWLIHWHFQLLLL